MESLMCRSHWIHWSNASIKWFKSVQMVFTYSNHWCESLR